MRLHCLMWLLYPLPTPHSKELGTGYDSNEEKKWSRKAVLSGFLDGSIKLIVDSIESILAGGVISIVPLPLCLAVLFGALAGVSLGVGVELVAASWISGANRFV